MRDSLRGWFGAIGVVALLGGSGVASAAGLPIDEQRGGIPTLAPVLREITGGVVSITASGAPNQTDNRFFGPGQQRQGQATGSGVIVDAANGYILTNHHVIANATRLSVRLKDGRQIDAKLVGSDSATDIAVLQIKADGLTAVPIGDSKSLEVGDFVVAIGNPFGVGQSASLGIVSAVGRGNLNIENIEDFIQTDAAINPGNSGGALVDMRGQVVGISTAIIAPGGATGGNVGIAFAVPMSIATAVMKQIVEHGDIQRGRLGVAMADVTPQVAKAIGRELAGGVVITRVEAASAAALAGLSPGDVILKLNGDDVRDIRDLNNKVALKRVGETVTLSALHDQKPTEFQVVLAVTPPTAPARAAVPALAGSVLADVDPARPIQGATKGVVVRSVDSNSTAFRNGFREGDLIQAVNNLRVDTLADFESAAKSADGTLAVAVVRDGQTQLLLVR